MLHFKSTISFVDIQQKTASVHTCRHAEKELVVFADGEYRRYIDERTFSLQITLFHIYCAIIL